MKTVTFYRNTTVLLYGIDFEIEEGSIFYRDGETLYLVSDDDYAAFPFDEENFKFYSKVEVAEEDPFD